MALPRHVSRHWWYLCSPVGTIPVPIAIVQETHDSKPDNMTGRPDGHMYYAKAGICLLPWCDVPAGKEHIYRHATCSIWCYLDDSVPSQVCSSWIEYYIHDQADACGPSGLRSLQSEIYKVHPVSIGSTMNSCHQTSPSCWLVSSSRHCPNQLPLGMRPGASVAPSRTHSHFPSSTSTVDVFAKIANSRNRTPLHLVTLAHTSLRGVVETDPALRRGEVC